MEKKSVKIVETVLRDGHQSLAATRMRINDMLPALERIDNVGYYAVEAWGGATFDACLRFLNEDPWQRLRTLKKHLPKTPIQMLLRGQNILGYNHYADDVVREFVKRSVANGVSIIRIFDALNDTRNLECAMRAAKEAGAHVQGCIVYTISPYHKDSNFVELGKELAQMGADSICIKDMAGLLRPYAAESLVRSLKTEVGLPVDLHTHFTSGMGDMTLLKAVAHELTRRQLGEASREMMEALRILQDNGAQEIIDNNSKAKAEAAMNEEQLEAYRAFLSAKAYAFYVGFETDTKYHHYNIDVSKYYETEE